MATHHGVVETKFVRIHSIIQIGNKTDPDPWIVSVGAKGYSFSTESRQDLSYTIRANPFRDQM
jgi:hypothetical protein